MYVCEMADLPGCSVAITSTCTTKLGVLMKLEPCGEHNFENKFLEVIF